MKQHVEEFLTKVENLNEADYGDFKRKVGQYLNDLDRDLGSSKQHRQMILQIRNDVVHVGLGNVEAGRSRVKELVRPHI